MGEGSAPSPGRVRVLYRLGSGELAETTLDRMSGDEIVDGLPVRECRSFKGQLHYSGWYWSTSVSRLVVYESRLELTRIILADFDPSVVGIIGQPFRLIGADGSRIRRHVPDLLLTSASGGVTVVDVKRAELRDEPKVRVQFGWTEAVLAARRWRFESWFGNPPSSQVVANVRFLARYRRAATVESSLIPGVLETVGDGSSIAQVERSLVGQELLLVRPVVMHLLWTGRLVTDLEQRLGQDSVVSLKRAKDGS